jgi:DNA-directed RNA polymerase specialized sigma24 family protein
MRRRLVTYFERKRVCVPDELVDETFNRIARRIAEEGQLTGDPPARYCYITAKFVFLEYLRRPRPSALPNVELAAPAKVHVDDDRREHRLDCLDRCLTELSERDRELILEYYGGEQQVKIEHRHRLADRLGLSANALTIRACRIRARLEACVSSCCGQK